MMEAGVLPEDLNTVWGYDAESGALDYDEPASLYLRADKADGSVLLLFMGFEYPQAICFWISSSAHLYIHPTPTPTRTPQGLIGILPDMEISGPRMEPTCRPSL